LYRETAIVLVQKFSKSFLPEAFCEAQNAPQWKSAGALPQIPLGELKVLP